MDLGKINNDIKKQNYTPEQNKLYCNRYRENNRDIYNAYIVQKVKERYANNADVRHKQSIYYKLRWYNLNIAKLEEKTEPLSSREIKRFNNLKRLLKKVEDEKLTMAENTTEA